MSKEQWGELAEIVEIGPERAIHGVVRWRRSDLKKVIFERFCVDDHERTVGKIPKAIGFSHINPRPRHPAQAPKIETRSKNLAQPLSAHIGHLPKRRPVEIWFQDEARIGQKNGGVRQWARRGTQPRQPADQRSENADLFGAICPARGVGAALTLPFIGTEAMRMHLDEISTMVAKGAHAVLLLDHAGWHTTGNLTVPKTATQIFLPSKSPELNPIKQIWW